MSVMYEETLQPRHAQIIMTLYKLRGGSPIQIRFGMYEADEIPADFPELSRKDKNSGKVSFVRNALTYLNNEGYVEIGAMVRYKRNSNVFHLTEKGRLAALELLNIPEGYVGEGFFEDYGYFPYELCLPPLKSIKHHDLTIDFYLKMRMLSRKFKKGEEVGFNFDFIDNRYSVKRFKREKKGSTSIEVALKPDAIIKVNDYLNWVEIDNVTEYADVLHKKFDGYFQYYEHIRNGLKIGDVLNQVPEAIFFITKATTDRLTRRWHTILRSFLETMGEWSQHINLYVGNLEGDSLENIIRNQQVNPPYHSVDLWSYYTEFLKARLNQLLVGKDKWLHLSDEEGKVLGWKPSICVTHPKDPNKEKPRLHVFERSERYESRGIARIIGFYEKYQNLKSLDEFRNSEFVPVLFCLNSTPSIPDLTKWMDYKKYQHVIDKALWYDVKAKEWYDASGKKLQSTNPLH